MDITPQDNSATQPISDDQELAKALAGVSLDEPAPEAPAPTNGFQFQATPAPSVPSVAPIVEPTASLPTPSAAPSSNLDDIKLDALKQLRPLMDKVELPAEEKFDTYLMLLRSTDDASLIAPAHAAAQGINDEKRKAEALLEVIKEIDYLSRKDQPAA